MVSIIFTRFVDLKLKQTQYIWGISIWKHFSLDLIVYKKTVLCFIMCTEYVSQELL